MKRVTYLSLKVEAGLAFSDSFLRQPRRRRFAHSRGMWRFCPPCAPHLGAQITSLSLLHRGKEFMNSVENCAVKFSTLLLSRANQARRGVAALRDIGLSLLGGESHFRRWHFVKSSHFTKHFMHEGKIYSLRLETRMWTIGKSL